MKRSTKKRVLALLLVVVMVVGLLPANMKTAKAEDKVYTLDASADLTAAAEGSLTDGGTITAGTDNYFTVYTSVKMKIDGSTKEFDDGYAATQRINPGGKSDVTVPKNAVAFKSEAAAKVKIWWVSGGNGRSMAITDTAGTVLTSTTAADSVKNTLYISTLEVAEAGNYFVAVPEGSNYIFKIEVTEEASSAPVVNEYVLDASADLTAAAEGSLTDGGTIKAGTSDFFTVYTSVKMKIDGSTKEFDDGYAATQRINPGGKSDVTVPKNAIGFTTEGTASVKIWWVSGGNGRSMAITDTAGTVLTSTTAADSVKNSLYISTLEIAEPGNYFVAVPEGSNYIFKVQVTDTIAAAPVVNDYVLDASADLTAAAEGSLTDGGTIKAGTSDFFTVYTSVKMKIDGSTKEFDDGYAATQRINPGGKSDVTVPKNAIGFTTEGTASVKIWWVSGGNGRSMAITDTAGTVLTSTTATDSVKNSLYISTLEIAEPGSYFIAVPEGSNYIFKVQVTDTVGGGTVETPRKDWSTVADPVLGTPTLKDPNTISVPYTMVIGDDGADVVVITVKDSTGAVVATLKSLVEGAEGTKDFAPKASGKYTFSIVASREGETDKTGTDVEFDYALPLTAPVIQSAANQGSGKVNIVWNPVTEATSYKVSYSADGVTFSTPVETSELSKEFTGLTVGTEYTFKVVAVRTTPAAESEASTVKATVTAKAEVVWVFSSFGQGISSSKTSATVTGNMGFLEAGSTVRIIAGAKNADETKFDSNCGKLVPADTDGLSFYYTAVPSNKNFTLSATAKVNMWRYSNGQEGFGLMAADRVGAHGDSSVFWNNSYMASITKVEYYYDVANNKIASSGDKISMKLGVGSQEKIGVTADNLNEFTTDMSNAMKKYFTSKMTTLDTTCAKMGAGTYNLLAKYDGNNAENASFTVTNIDNLVSEFKLTIQKNNTGYFVTYENVATGEKTTQKYYDTEALSQIDKDNVYVGFFASRYADVTFSDISFTTIDPSEDAPAEEKPVTYVDVVSNVTSESTSNSEKYEFNYVANADGKLTLKDSKGNVLVDNKEVKANEKFKMELTLEPGKNKFTTEFTPNADFLPDGDPDKKLSSYDKVTSNLTVQYTIYGEPGQALWVSPTGSKYGTGNKVSPLDIYTAVKFVQAGQTIVLMEGTYKLDSTVKVPRGTDGTAESLIYMVVDPDAKTRPVFDFGGKCAGMVFAGDYWYVQGFDVTNSSNGQKGLQVSGSNNTFDDITAYYNGNTGIQISRYLSTDTWEDWPANNLILNCTSYCNADAGYEDADGFAAKLTIAGGNVFDGCIAYYNADDGWDLFAKPETGPIGDVVIKNCVTYKNGYWINREGKVVDAGNGNGFKMGGSSISGKHQLINCITYDNKAKGIDSNSGPDIIVENCTSFNNGSFNVALYTNNATNTDYKATGIVSFRVGTDVDEQLKFKGTQVESQVKNDTNYFWNTYVAGKSTNLVGTEVTADWFVSLDTSIVPTRDADGTINMNGLLEKTSSALAGATMVDAGTASAVVTIPESVPNVKPVGGGDASNAWLYVILSIAAISAVAAVVVVEKKKVVR